MDTNFVTEARLESFLLRVPLDLHLGDTNLLYSPGSTLRLGLYLLRLCPVCQYAASTEWGTTGRGLGIDWFTAVGCSQGGECGQDYYEGGGQSGEVHDQGVCVWMKRGFDGGFGVDYDSCARGSGCSACESWSVDDPKLMVDS